MLGPLPLEILILNVKAPLAIFAIMAQLIWASQLCLSSRLYGVSMKEVLEIMALTQILPIGRKEMLVATIEEVMGITIFAQTLPTYAKEVLVTIAKEVPRNNNISIDTLERSRRNTGCNSKSSVE